MAAAGIIKGNASNYGVLDYQKQIVLGMLSLKLLFMLPIPLLIAVTAARKFKMNGFTALAISGALVYPTLATIPALADAGLDKIFGISLELPSSGSYLNSNAKYPCNVVASLIEKNIKKITPDVVKLFRCSVCNNSCYCSVNILGCWSSLLIS